MSQKQTAKPVKWYHLQLLEASIWLDDISCNLKNISKHHVYAEYATKIYQGYWTQKNCNNQMVESWKSFLWTQWPGRNHRLTPLQGKHHSKGIYELTSYIHFCNILLWLTPLNTTIECHSYCYYQDQFKRKLVSASLTAPKMFLTLV